MGMREPADIAVLVSADECDLDARTAGRAAVARALLTGIAGTAVNAPLMLDTLEVRRVAPTAVQFAVSPPVDWYSVADREGDRRWRVTMHVEAIRMELARLGVMRRIGW